MTPEEKAKELFVKYSKLTDLTDSNGRLDHDVWDKRIRQCVNITVDEILELAKRSDLFFIMTKSQRLNNFKPTEQYEEYWEEVRKKADNLWKK